MTYVQTRKAEIAANAPYKVPHKNAWLSWCRHSYNGIGGVKRSTWFSLTHRLYGLRTWEITPWHECRRCRVRSGSKRHIQYRSLMYVWAGEAEFDWESRPVLCMRCWNQTRGLRKRLDETEEVRREIGRLQRAISHERKNQDSRRIA